MFIPKTEKIKEIAKTKQTIIKQLESLFGDATRMYIDYANVRPWSSHLGWHIDIRRLKQFLDSFSSIEAVNFYNGYLEGDKRSEREKQEVENCKYVLRTKPVKIMKSSINASRIPSDSTALLKRFIRQALLRMYEVGTIENLNERFKDMNKRGVYFIEDRKCNFDVEIGVDMLLDCERNKADTFVLWSGDSDFADPIGKLMVANKHVVLFVTAGKVSTELSNLVKEGLFIFEIRKIKDFICWNSELKTQKGPL